MSEAKYREVKAEDQPVQYNASEKFDGKGQAFKVLETEDLSIALFHSKLADADPGEKKAQVVANAWVTLKGQDVTFQMTFRKLLSDGSIIAGGKSRTPNHKAVISDYDKAKNASYERMSIGGNLYRKILAIVSEQI